MAATNLLRSFIFSALAVLAAAGAFAAGARAGAALDGHAAHVTIAKFPMPALGRP